MWYSQKPTNTQKHTHTHSHKELFIEKEKISSYGKVELHNIPHGFPIATVEKDAKSVESEERVPVGKVHFVIEYITNFYITQHDLANT